MPEYQEKRKHPRVFFSVENRLSAEFEKPRISAMVLDMSLGGMGLSLARAGGSEIERGKRIRLVRIHGRNGFEVMGGFFVEIRWVLDQSGFEHIAFGCRFVDPPKQFLDGIYELIQHQLSRLSS